jgi:hypothetical protein
MMKAKNKILSALLVGFCLAASVAWAVGGVLPPATNTTAQPIAGANSSTGAAIVVSADPTTGALFTTPVSTSTSGATMLFDSACDNSAQTAKASAGFLAGLDIYNANGTNMFLQLFDSATAPTVGTTVPNYVLFIPAMGGYAKDATMMLTFSNKIYYACTTTATGSGAPSTALTASFGIK